MATTTLALKGLRQDKSADHLLRTVMLHVGCGYSLRETAVRARESGLADLSDVALLKRLRKCEQWLYALGVGLWQQRGLARLRAGQRTIRLIDATTVKEPGQTGSLWRIHYSLMPFGNCVMLVRVEVAGVQNLHLYFGQACLNNCGCKRIPANDVAAPVPILAIEHGPETPPIARPVLAPRPARAQRIRMAVGS